GLGLCWQRGPGDRGLWLGGARDGRDSLGGGRPHPRDRFRRHGEPRRRVAPMSAIAPAGMMNAVVEARRARLKHYFRPDHKAIASINSPMQCMMKEICAQCLQLQRDPVTGTETVVFSCYNQDQEMDRVDFPALHRRLSQNSVQEKLNKLWIDR